MDDRSLRCPIHHQNCFLVDKNPQNCFLVDKKNKVRVTARWPTTTPSRCWRLRLVKFSVTQSFSWQMLLYSLPNTNWWSVTSYRSLIVHIWVIIAVFIKENLVCNLLHTSLRSLVHCSSENLQKHSLETLQKPEINTHESYREVGIE